MEILITILLALPILVSVLSAYLLLLTVAAWFHRPADRGSGAGPRTFVFVIPAHNEEGQIATTVRSALDSGMPPLDVRAVVIADNCSDATAARARDAGAEVVERCDPDHRGKGQALDWFFRSRLDLYTTADVVVIVDADTVVGPAFPRVVSESMADPGVQVVQGFYGVANPEESWRTALSAAALAVFHHVRPAGRNVVGGSAGLRGNGMAFRSEIPERYGWPAHSIVEDLEFTLRLVEDRILVHYLPNAVVLGEMARTAAQATPQRERWEGGRVALLKAYAPGLVRAWFRRPRMALVDAFMDLVIPPLTLLVGMQVFSACLLACFHPVGWGLLAVFAVIDLFYVLSGLLLRHVPCRVWMALVAAPVFVLWKVPVYVRMLIRGGPARWVRTPRRGEEEPGSR